MDRWTRANNRLKRVAAGFGFAWVHLISFLPNPIGKPDIFFSRRHMPLRLPREVSAPEFFPAKRAPDSANLDTPLKSRIHIAKARVR
jgi:hypothetical protein